MSDGVDKNKFRAIPLGEIPPGRPYTGEWAVIYDEDPFGSFRQRGFDNRRTAVAWIEENWMTNQRRKP